MSASETQFWGRAYKLTVTPTSGPKQVLSCDAWEPEALRVTFDILETTLPAQMWFAEITVYNINEADTLQALWNAAWVELEAGYQTGPNKSSLIWGGPVLQVMFDRENVVDFKITFSCIATTQLWTDNFMSAARGPMASQYQIVSDMITNVGGSPSANISSTAAEKLQAKQYPRGRTLFGSVAKYISQIAQDNGLAGWLAANQPYMSELDSGVKTVPDLVYGPALPPGFVAPQPSQNNIARTVIGVPKMHQYGVIFTVLLDPRLVVQAPPLLVHLDKTVISQFKLVPLGNLPVPLDKSLMFVAAQVHHYGDTRGGQWYTEVTGYSRAYAQGLLLKILNGGKS